MWYRTQGTLKSEEKQIANFILILIVNVNNNELY